MAPGGALHQYGLKGRSSNSTKPARLSLPRLSDEAERRRTAIGTVSSSRVPAETALLGRGGAGVGLVTDPGRGGGLISAWLQAIPSRWLEGGVGAADATYLSTRGGFDLAIHPGGVTTTAPHPGDHLGRPVLVRRYLSTCA